jgi:hypothetical protein
MKISNENKLLFFCSKLLSGTSSNEEIIPLLQNTLDWQNVVKKAKRYSIGSAIYCILSKHPNNNLIQKKYLLQLKEDYLETLGRNTIVVNEVKVLLKILKQANIDVVLLKGAALLASVYPGLAYRFMSDIDVLVRESDLVKSQENLLAHGYIQNVPTYNLKKNKHHHLPAFWNPAKNIRIEIHWTLGNTDQGVNIDINEVWSRIQESKIEGLETLILSPEDMILHQCFHLFFNFVNIVIYKTLYDIVAIIQCYGDSIDWNLIADCCEKYHLETPVYAILFLIKDQLAMNVPSDVLSLLRSKSSINQISWMETKYKKTGMETLGKNIYSKQGYKRKIAYIFSKFFPPVEYLYYKYSVPADSKFVYFYYIVRPFHLLYKYTTYSIITVFKLVPLFSRNQLNQKIEKSIYNTFEEQHS